MPFRFNPITGSFDLTGDVTLPARVSVLEDKYVRTTRFTIISEGTSGTITLPASSTAIMDDFGGTVDAVVSAVSNSRPTFQTTFDASGNIIATTFDSSGNFTLNGTPSSYPIAILYRVRSKLKDFDSGSSDIVGIPWIEHGLSDTGKHLLSALSGETVGGILYTDTDYSIKDIAPTDTGQIPLSDGVGSWSWQELPASSGTEINGFLEVPLASTYPLVQYSTKAYTLDKIWAKMASGSVTLTVNINGTPVTGMSTLSITDSESENIASAANSVSVGDTVTVTIASPSSAQDLSFTISGI